MRFGADNSGIIWESASLSSEGLSVVAPLDSALSAEERSRAQRALGRALSDSEAYYVQRIIEALGGEGWEQALQEQRRFSLGIEQVAHLAHYYGRNWKSLYELLKPHRLNEDTRAELWQFESDYRQFLVRISVDLNQSEFTYYLTPLLRIGEDREIFESNPEKFTKVMERYGDGGLALFAKYKFRALNLDQAELDFYDRYHQFVGGDYYHNFLFLNHCIRSDIQLSQSRDTILSLAEVLKNETGVFLAGVSEEVLLKTPARVIEIAKDLGRRGADLIEILGDDLIDIESATLERMKRLCKYVAEASQDHLPKCFKEGGRVELHRSLTGFIKLLNHFKKDGVRLIHNFGHAASRFTDTEIRELDQIKADLVKDDAEEHVAVVFENISPALFMARPGFYADLVKKLGFDAKDVVVALKKNDNFAIQQKHLLERAITRMGSFAGDFIESVPATLSASLCELANNLIARVGLETTSVFKSASHEFLRAHKFQIYRHLLRYGYGFPALLRRFGEQYFEKEALHSAHIEKLYQLTPAGAPEILDYVPEALWGDERLYRAIKVYEEATGPEYNARGESFFDNETPALTKLRLRCKKEFGIRNFHRLCPIRGDGSLDTSVLYRNLKNLELVKKFPGIPIFVDVLPLDDWNQAFKDHSKVLESANRKLAKKGQGGAEKNNVAEPLAVDSGVQFVFYVESEGAMQTTQLLHRLAALRGVNEEGDPLYPLEHVTLSHHASDLSFAPGYRTAGELKILRANPSAHVDSLYGMEDFALFELWGKCIRESLVLNGCLTGLRGPAGLNIANLMKQAMPHLTIIANRESSSLVKYGISPEGRVFGARFYDDRAIHLEEPPTHEQFFTEPLPVSMLVASMSDELD